MKFTKYTFLGILALSTIPFVSFATADSAAGEVIKKILDFIEGLTELVIAFALLYFLFNLARYAFSKKEETRQNSRKLMLWGLIGLAIMVFLWAAVNMISQTVFENNDVGVSLLSEQTNSLQETPGQNKGSGSFGNSGNDTVQGITETLVRFIESLFPYMLVLGAFLFIYGVYSFIRNENVQKKAHASMYMLWGIILLFVMVSIWGIINAIGDTLQIPTERQTDIDTERIDPSTLIKGKR